MPGTYSVFGLGCRATLILVGILDGDSLLPVDRLAGDQVGGCEKILLATTGNEDALVTMGLNDDLLAAGATGTAATTTAWTASCCQYLAEGLGCWGKRTLHGRDHRPYRRTHHDREEHHRHGLVG